MYEHYIFVIYGPKRVLSADKLESQIQLSGRQKKRT